jgi:imidazolonepropionase-like amidohydrolase
MKRALVVLSLLLFPASADAQEALAFTGVNVIPMDRETVLRNQTVVVSNGRITSLGAADRVTVPAGATRVEAQGKFLMPGLAEMHGHIPSPNQSGSLEFAEDVLFLYVAGGVTTVRGMLGHPAHLDLKRRVNAGELVGPRIWTSGPSINGRSAPTPAAAESMVIAQKAAGYDFMKIHPGPSRATFDALDRVADSVGMRYAGHVPTAVGVPRALEAGYWSIDHLDGYMQALVAEGAEPADVEAPLSAFGPHLAPYVDEAKIAELARRTKEAGVWNVPTETLMQTYLPGITLEHFTERPELRYMPAQWIEGWTQTQRNVLSSGVTDETKRRFIEVRQALIRALHAEGAGLLLGSDAPQIWNVPGFSVHHELAAIVAAGLTPYEALVTGTRNVAAYFGVADAGTIAVGQRADLILLNANPLEDIRNSTRRAGVVVNGRWLPAAEIATRLEAIAAKHAR